MERKANINNVKPCSMSDLIEYAWDSFLGYIKTIHIDSVLGHSFEQCTNLVLSIYFPDAQDI